LWERGWRMGGLAPMVIGLCLWLASAVFRPDILVEGQGRVIAVRNANGDMEVNSRRMARHANKEWALQEGLMQGMPLRREGSARACDPSLCLFAARSGDRVALVRDSIRLQEACARASIVIASVKAESCQGPRLVLDADDLSRNGAHAMWLTSDDVILETVSGERGRRPWAPAKE
ncbi:MAG: ComEC family competence protein, partial [Pseudomonadota bacterium]